MLKTSHVVEVIEENCIGCKACDRVCPTEAIVTTNKLAVVDEDKCTGCNKCLEACMDHMAIKRKLMPKGEYQLFANDVQKYPTEKIDAFCKLAKLTPETAICPCTGTTAAEIAVAIFDGAKTADDISLQTGVRGVCSMWCTTIVFRMMEAAGLEQPSNPKNWRIYPDGNNSAISLWGVNDTIAEKYPEYRIKQSKELLKETTVYMPGFGGIRGDKQ